MTTGCGALAPAEPESAEPEPADWHPLPATIGAAPGEILRIDNDRDRPQCGLLFVTVEVAP